MNRNRRAAPSKGEKEDGAARRAARRRGMNIDHRLTRLALAQACGAAVLACATARADPSHDIHYLAEHVPESGMDAHYQALPWPAGKLSRGAWQTSLDLSSASTRTEFI